MLTGFQANLQSPVPVYRQLADFIRDAIQMGSLRNNDRLPATRELASQLNLNRTTVSAAYAVLEEIGLVEGQVGRGSFVRSGEEREPARRVAPISFASSRPADHEFPLADFQTTCREVAASSEAVSILQLGSPLGYGPLRRYLLAEARREGCAGPEDDVLITSGCQQGLDLTERVLRQPSTPVVVEDPVYHGIRNVFGRAGQHLVGVPVGPGGINLEALARTLADLRPGLLVLTPNFQNPTGETLDLDSRVRLLDLVRQFDVTLVENDTYGALRYVGEPLPTLKQLDPSGRVILLRSFSKIAFPGLRVGWMIGSRAVIARLADARQWCDLHTDQLSQAILLRFLESGRLTAHLDRVCEAGRFRLEAALEACRRHLPAGSTYTCPEGGMNIWVRLPEPLDAGMLLPRMEREHVTYLPGSYFGVTRQDPGTLRLSFGSLTPDGIRAGIATIGRVCSEELARSNGSICIGDASAVV
ncbi:MAG TPA: PLP-dependent aminotransferase family protein [Bryobacteraceae bacterium]|nr:PLP-dependent aminotransferase family protein [Bryobacteraceae bacterium]